MYCMIKTLCHRRSISTSSTRMFGAIKTLVKSLQAPPHTIANEKEDGKDLEVRSYAAAKWVSTSVKRMTHKEATHIGFNRLFKYIQGENLPKTEVEMTVPVAVKVEPGEGPACESTFTISFYIPQEHQKKPPEPTNKEIFIEERPAMSVYVRSFGGFASDEDWIEQSKKLMAAIGNETKYETHYFYTAGYNSPFRLTGRTNDVWLMKKN